jgi:hypothetical protein
MLIQLSRCLFAAEIGYSLQDLIAILANSRHLVLTDLDCAEFIEWEQTKVEAAARLRGLVNASAHQVRAGLGLKRVVVHAGPSNWMSAVPR